MIFKLGVGNDMFVFFSSQYIVMADFGLGVQGSRIWIGAASQCY